MLFAWSAAVALAHARAFTMSLPKLYTLREAVAAFNSSGVTEKSLRREVYAGRLRAVRTRPSHNAKILILEQDLLAWLENSASKRQFVPVPVRASAVRTERSHAA